jgi:hypothetical protein
MSIEVSAVQPVVHQSRWVRRGPVICAAVICAAILCAAMLVGCSPSPEVASSPALRQGRPSEPAGLASSGPVRLGPQGCRSADLVDGSDPLAALGLAVAELDRVVEQPEHARAGDCEVSQRPLCAALFLLGVTDPVMGFALGIGRADLARLSELHTTVLGLALSLAEETDHEDLDVALRQLAALDNSVVLDRDENAVADVVIARAAPEIVGPISSAEQGC